MPTGRDCYFLSTAAVPGRSDRGQTVSHLHRVTMMATARHRIISFVCGHDRYRSTVQQVEASVFWVRHSDLGKKDLTCVGKGVN
jgi:hypothetical protein